MTSTNINNTLLTPKSRSQSDKQISDGFELQGEAPMCCLLGLGGMNANPAGVGTFIDREPTNNSCEVNKNLTNKKPTQTTKHIERLKIQTLKIATLNIRGFEDKQHKSKHNAITMIMMRQKIHILLLQETHLTDEKTTTLNSTNPNFEIISNSNSTSTAGIAYVINRRLLPKTKYQHKIITDNRISTLKITWFRQDFEIINVYAPNNRNDKLTFVKQLELAIQSSNPKNIILAGDFNMVIYPEDRNPTHRDEIPAVKELTQILNKYELVDGWKESHPDELDYTFYQNNQNGTSTSRIDRIYIHKSQYKRTPNWKIQTIDNITDHNLAYMEITQENQPYQEQSRWRITEQDLKDKQLLHKLSKRLQQFEKAIERKSQTQLWPEMQTRYCQMKDDLRKITLKHRRYVQNERIKKIKQLETTKIKLLQEEKLEHNVNNLRELHSVNKQIQKEHTTMTEKMQLAARAKYQALGEQCTKYWFALGKQQDKYDTISELRQGNNTPETDTKQMNKVAQAYHQELQNPPNIKNVTKRKEATIETLNSIEQTITEETDYYNLAIPITLNETETALKQGQNSKAPGHDGLTYEFWKAFKEPTTPEEHKKDPSITRILTKLFDNIEHFGITDERINKGIMSLLYKKKDRRNIENYRPLTLMNVDYKIYTKSIANRLGKIAPKLIHPDQAGFVPGRNLYNHTRLSLLMPQYCSMTNTNGCIVSLDQEKAYDKIAHDYLYKVLKRMNFPEPFIQRIRNLYTNATTTIIINGVESDPILIERGVRQGDPMSCLLYNLAIEPLACLIRNSKLEGIPIENTTNALVKLFADDTLLYLKSTDNLQLVKKILNTFCQASTAKFNLEKTEYLPLGTPTFRKQMINKRRLGQKNTNQIEPNVRIIDDHNLMRTLGTWIGNECEIPDKWEEILEQQRRIIETWKPMYPSFRAKELILKQLICSRATYLATVNTMPKDIENRMQKLIRNFVWDDRKIGLLPWNQTINKREHGGLNMPDLRSRLEAIDLMWVKQWLAPPENKPTWAYVADAFVKYNVYNERLITEDSIINWIEQTWQESLGPDSTIPKPLQTIMNTARKYNIAVYGRKFDENTKLNMPITHHLGVENNYLWNKQGSKQLRAIHQVRTVGDLLQVQDNPNCKKHKLCNNMKLPLLELLPEKYKPDSIRKDPLSHGLSTKQREHTKNIQQEPVLFNPSVRETGHPRYATRVFMPSSYKGRGRLQNFETSLRDKPERLKYKEQREHITLYTDGASINNGTDSAITGAGVWHAENSKHNRSIRIPDNNTTPHKSNQRAEMIAIILAGQIKPTDDLTIITDSLTVAEGITQKTTEWEDNNWIGVQNADLWQVLLATLRKRSGKVYIKWTKGHADCEGNNKADELAGKATKKPKPDKLNLEINKEWEMLGARLQSLTQKTAYENIIRIRAQKPNNTSSTLNYHIEDAKDMIEAIMKTRPNNKNIYKGITNKPFTNRHSDFIWKLINNKHRCGRFFLHIPHWEEKAYCRCHELETIEHILLYCDKAPLTQMWSLAQQTWKVTNSETTTTSWPQISIGILRGIGALLFKKQDGRPDTGATFRYKIIITITAWIIWKLRCKIAIENITIKLTDYKQIWYKELSNYIQNTIWQAQHLSNNPKKELKKIKNIWGKNETLIKNNKEGLLCCTSLKEASRTITELL